MLDNSGRTTEKQVEKICKKQKKQSTVTTNKL